MQITGLFKNNQISNVGNLDVGTIFLPLLSPADSARVVVKKFKRSVWVVNLKTGTIYTERSLMYAQLIDVTIIRSVIDNNRTALPEDIEPGECFITEDNELCIMTSQLPPAKTKKAERVAFSFDGSKLIIIPHKILPGHKAPMLNNATVIIDRIEQHYDISKLHAVTLALKAEGK